MAKIKVLFAYCHELDRSISIDSARLEYFSQDPKRRKRFTFSCSDRNCGVLISGVNYHVMAEAGEKFIAAHYRSPHTHSPCCEWIQFTNEIEQCQRKDESDEEFNEKKARMKLKDYINHFTHWSDNEDKIEASCAVPNTSSNSLKTPGHSNNKDNDKGNDRWQRYTKTNQLQRLIDTWQEAKENLSYIEYSSLNLHVTNHGKVPFYQYITHIKNGLSNQYNGVIYGGGRINKRYGRGFLFQFFDKFNDQTIHLYISKELMNNGRFGHYINEILNTKNVKYFRVFLLNPRISEREDKNGNMIINLKISNLKQLVMYYELNDKTSDDTGSDGNNGDKCA